MKILVSSDIHGNVELLKKLKEKAKDVDLLLYCGDVAENPAGEDEQRPYFNNLYAIFDEIKAPCRFIRGNCDGILPDSKYYLSKPEQINGIWFIPFEYVLPTPSGCTFREVSEEEIRANLGEIVLSTGRLPSSPTGDGAIIVAHQPPFGAGDELDNGMHVGSKAITKWIENEKPLYWLCGHVHEANGEYDIGGTKVVNAAADGGNNELREYMIEI